MTNQDVSILIPTFNRPETLLRVIGSYSSQANVREILVLDDGSTVSYEPYLKRLEEIVSSSGVSFRYLRSEDNLGAGATRNRGIKSALGEYILWGEDDAFLGDDYVEKLLPLVRDGRTIACGSIYYGITPEMEAGDRKLLIQEQRERSRPLFDFRTLEGYYRKLVPGPTEIPWGHALVLVPVQAYRSVEFFEGYRVNGYREETDAQVSMSAAGYKCLYTSECSCYHFPADNLRSGQHTSARWKQELFTVVNTGKFIGRHWATLASWPGFGGSPKAAYLRYILYRMRLLLAGAVRKFKRVVR